MSRTGLTLVTAFALAALSVGLMLGRWHVLGKEIDGTPGTGTWKVVEDKFLETEVVTDGDTKKVKQEAKIADDSLELKDPSGQTFKFKRVK